MKRISILVCVLAAFTAAARPAGSEDSLESQLNVQPGKATSPLSNEPKLNEIVKGNVTYSGIAVQVIKTDNLLQLVNPLAPPKYGSGEENVMRDPATGRGAAWKLFSIQF
jgi:hypothetical protein